MVWKPEYGQKKYDTCKCGNRKAKTAKQCRKCYEAARQQARHPRPGYNRCECGKWKAKASLQCKACDTQLRQDNAGSGMIDVACSNCGTSFRRWSADTKDAIHNAYCSVECRQVHYGVHPILDMSEDLAYVLGVSYGDGHVSPSRFVLRVTDLPFAQATYDALECLNFRPSLTHKSVQVLRQSKSKKDGIWPTKDQYVVSACSREFVTWHHKLTFDILSDKLDSPSLIIAFLRGFYESDGSVRSDSLTFYNTNEPLLDLTEHLTKSIGFSFRRRIAKRLPSGKTLYSLSIHIKASIGQFLYLIRPCIKNRHSHYHPDQLALV